MPNSPICVRDVRNVDKQDDAAAYRTFHSDLISMCQKDGVLMPGKAGFFVYMFILGELFDAYLNSQINHKTRIIMVMRAYFFLQYWKTFINKAHLEVSAKWYSYMRSFISLQSYNIFTSLTESLILLIIAHRDYCSNYPLLLWEHGTEVLEHVFGIARQLVPDFTTYKFFKHPDIQLILIHIYSIDSEILEILQKWPSNSEIYDAIRIAHQNAFNFAKMIDLVSNELKLAPIVFVDNNNLVDEDEDKELMSIDDDEEKRNNEDIINEDNINKYRRFRNTDDENDDDDSIDDKDYDDSNKENDEISYNKTSNQMTAPENTLFDANRNLIVSSAIKIRQSHNAFVVGLDVGLATAPPTSASRPRKNNRKGRNNGYNERVVPDVADVADVSEKI
ncbi:hypothetical protein RhiirB3_455442 [Rhizophagus irregularis]|nr:hypothetical protein RhiirB3_455442 [Rhizophagus irregularis]